MRWRRHRLVAAATVGLLVTGVVPASAEPTGRISSISTTEGEVTLTFTATGLPADTSIDPASIQVTLGGTEVEAAAQPLSEAAQVPERTVVLAMDVSGSMAEDGRIDAAKAAATSFLDQLPSEVRAGLVSFAETADVIVPPTQRRQQVRRAIDRLQPEGDTALYDGVLLAVATTGDTGIRSSIVLSDGADTVSTADLESTVVDVRESDVQVDAVAFGAGAEDAVGPLTQVTAASGGQVVRAGDAAELARVFDVAAQSFTNELLVTAQVPEDFSSAEARLLVTADAGGTPVTAEAFVTIAAGVTEARPAAPTDFGPTPVPPGPDPVPRWALVAGIVAVGLGLALVLWMAFGGARRREEDTVRGRLSVYTLSGARPKAESEQVTTALGSSATARSAVELAGRFVRQRDFEDNLTLRLDAAGLPLRAAEWVLIHTGSAVGLGLLFLVLFGFRLVPALVGLAIGVVGPFIFLTIKADRRRNRFVDQMPDTLQLMAGSLSAGYSLPQSVDTVVREGVDPMSPEFNRALIESRLGIPIEDTLEEVAERMQSRDFLWVVMAIRIQRQVGGNLAELLNTVAATLRERAQLRRQVRVLSAEGRISAWIIGLLPVVFGLYLLLVNPGYLSPLVRDILGWIMLGVGVVLMIVGVLWMRKIVDVEV